MSNAVEKICKIRRSKLASVLKKQKYFCSQKKRFLLLCAVAKSNMLHSSLSVESVCVDFFLWGPEKLVIRAS